MGGQEEGRAEKGEATSMDSAVITTLISTSGAVIAGLGGMWISTNQICNRMADLATRFDHLTDELRNFREEFNG